MSIDALPTLDRTSPTFRAECNTFFGTQLPLFSEQVEAARVAIVASQAATAASAAAAAGSATAAGSSATAAAGSATAASGSATAAAASATAAAGYGSALAGTSTTSLAIAVASKSFTADTGKQWAVGQFLVAASLANPANFMHGQVTSYNSGTGALVLNVLDIGGSGTKADWVITLSAPKGDTGASGGLGANTFTGDQNYSGNKLINAVLQQIAEVKAAPAISAGVLALDCANAMSAVALNANITSLTLANTLASSSVVQSHTVAFTADGTARTIAWPSGNGTSTLLFKHPGGTAPTMTSTNGKRDVLMFVSVSQFLWDVFVVGQNL